MNIELLKLSNKENFIWHGEINNICLPEIINYHDSSDKYNYFKKEFFNVYSQYFFSINHLYHGIKIGEKDNIPLQSILSLTRSSLENYSMFHHIYIAAKNKDTSLFRFWSWWRDGLMYRQKYHTIDNQYDEKRNNEKEYIKTVYDDLIEFENYKKMTKKEKINFDKYGKWTNLTWKDKLYESGFSYKFADTIYNHLSSFSHSGSISLIQQSEADEVILKEIIDNILRALFIANALYIYSFSKLLPSIEKLLKDKDVEYILCWKEMGRILYK